MIILPLRSVLLVLFDPNKAFTQIQKIHPDPLGVLLGCALWLGLIPPLCSFLGTSWFGWRIGLHEAVVLPVTLAFFICLAYYAALLCIFAFTSYLLRRVQTTYSVHTPIGDCFALIVAAGVPLMLGGFFHIYPSLALNLALLTPALCWSVYLLYTGVPLVLNIDKEKGTLIASFIVGVLLVSIAAILALIMMLWVNGFGPPLGI